MKKHTDLTIRKYLLFFSLFILASSISHAQPYLIGSIPNTNSPDYICDGNLSNSNWYFGEGGGIHFGSAGVVPLTNGQIDHPFNPSATVSDQSGNLLFYTDGRTVYNKNHVPMQNGNGTLNGTGSKPQDVVIVPKPNDPIRYYIFYLDDDNTDRYYYSIVNTSANNGLGSVETLNVNLGLLPYVNTDNETYWEQDSEVVKHNMTVTKHSDCESYWLIINPFHKFFAFRISSNGISAPAISDAEGQHQPWGDYEWTSSGMKVSLDGRFLAYSREYIGSSSTIFEDIYIWNFNATTGIITPNDNIQHYGGHSVEFSPNGEFLYANSGEYIYQYNTDDLSNGYNPINGTNNSVGPSSTALQLGTDGRIYISKAYTSSLNNLSVINNPDLEGANCNFVLDQVSLSGGEVGNSLPQLVPCFCINDASCYINSSLDISNNCPPLTPTCTNITFEPNIEVPFWSYIDYYEWTITNTINNTVVYSNIGTGNPNDLNYSFPQYGAEYEICLSTRSRKYANSPFTFAYCATDEICETFVIGGKYKKSNSSNNVDQKYDELSFEIYPNPTENKFTIELKSSGENTTVSLQSMDGKQLFMKSFEDLKMFEFDLSDFSSGLYIVSVKSGEIIKTKRVVKN
ncbi:MAG: T9SS type A sorting domain-containing protein [Crocinitomicaceae bacterium]